MSNVVPINAKALAAKEAVRESRRVNREKYMALLTKRLRALRVSLGYETAASFSRAIGYPPDRYGRYERRAPIQTGVVLRLVWAIKASGHGQVSYDWLFETKFAGPMILTKAKVERLPS